MDTNTLIAIIAFAVVIVVALILYRNNRVKANIKGPGGIGMGIDASNEKPQSAPGIQINDAKSRQGGLQATNETEGGISVKRVEVEKDIKVTNKPPREDGSPKA